ncbi:MAG: alpha/beta fold hydrolase [Bacteroidota bacterium]
MTKKRKKRILIVTLFSVICITIAGYGLYDTVFVSDIPITQPNVNTKELHALEIKEDTLKDYLKNPLAVVDFGKFVVKEDRSSETSNKIELYFERIKTTSKNPLAPIFFLAGGPGSAGTDVGRTEYFFLFRELSKYADVILLDQRGTGSSIPNLHCRNFLDTPTDITKNVQEQILKDLVKKCAECADEFTKVGIQLKSYNSLESAFDIDELREALDYESIVLYGYSYGTELAQMYIKNFGQHVEKAIFAGSLGPDHGVKLPSEVERSYQILDSLVQQDVKLRKVIPSFSNLMRRVHEDTKSESKPIAMDVLAEIDEDDSMIEKIAINAASTFKSSWEMTLTFDHFQMMMADKIGQDRSLHELPAFYHKLDQGDFSQVAHDLKDFRGRRMPNAIFFTVNGASRYSSDRWEQSVLESDTTFFSHFGISYGRFPEVYEAFGIPVIDGLNHPVASDHKVLFIDGTLDGRTPAQQTEALLLRFPNHSRITIENVGHNRLLNNEVMKQMMLFLKDSVVEHLKIHRPMEFKAPIPYQYALKDTLLSTLRNTSVTEAVTLYQNLWATFGSSEDYDFDFSANTIDAIFDDLMEEKRYAEAVQWLKRLIEIVPESALLYRDLGEVYITQKEHSRARPYLTRALEMDFFDPKTQALFELINKKTK